MDNKTKIDFNDPDLFFRINVKNNNNLFEWRELNQFRTKENDILEITTNCANIENIECISCENAQEMIINYPPLETLFNRKKYYYSPVFINENNYLNSFNIIYSKNDMNIIFDDDLSTINSYHKDERFIYYTNNNRGLVMLRVSNLTPEEYKQIQIKKNLFPSINFKSEK